MTILEVRKLLAEKYAENDKLSITVWHPGVGDSFIMVWYFDEFKEFVKNIPETYEGYQIRIEENPISKRLRNADN